MGWGGGEWGDARWEWGKLMNEWSTCRLDDVQGVKRNFIYGALLGKCLQW